VGQDQGISLHKSHFSDLHYFS